MDLAAVLTLEILNGIASLVLMSVGLAIIFGMMRVINLAHGEFLMLGGYAAIVATNQGVDLCGYLDNRFLASVEYISKYNLGYDVPYETYNWGTGQNGAWQTQTVVSAGGRGNGRPDPRSDRPARAGS